MGERQANREAVERVAQRIYEHGRGKEQVSLDGRKYEPVRSFADAKRLAATVATKADMRTSGLMRPHKLVGDAAAPPVMQIVKTEIPLKKGWNEKRVFVDQAKSRTQADARSRKTGRR